MASFKRILQITDTHLFAKPTERLLGINTYQSLSMVVKDALITPDPAPDMILLTGDLAQDESQQAYQNLVKLMAPFNMPVAWLPGNHDAPNIMPTVLNQQHFISDKVIPMGEWLMILLDSHWHGNVPGLLSNIELEFLENTINQQSHAHILVTLHHQVIPVGSHWLDKLKLSNDNAFLKILDKHQSRVRAVLSGHVHQENEQLHNNILFMTTPSSCFQFSPNSPTYTIGLEESPGYRIIDLHPDGRLDTQVVRVKIDEQPDPNSHGY